MTLEQAKLVITDYSEKFGVQMEWFSPADLDAGKLHAKTSRDVVLSNHAAGFLVHFRSKIYLRSDAEPDELVAVFLHELGHIAYCQQTPSGTWSTTDSEAMAYRECLDELCGLCESGKVEYLAPLRHAVEVMQNAVDNPENEQKHPATVEGVKRVIAEPVFPRAKKLIGA